MNHENNIAKIVSKLDGLAGDPRTDFEVARAAIQTAHHFHDHYYGQKIAGADWDRATDSAAEAVALMNDRKVRKATIINKRNVRRADFVFAAATAGKGGFDRDEVAGLVRKAVRLAS